MVRRGAGSGWNLGRGGSLTVALLGAPIAFAVLGSLGCLPSDDDAPPLDAGPGPDASSDGAPAGDAAVPPIAPLMDCRMDLTRVAGGGDGLVASEDPQIVDGTVVAYGGLDDEDDTFGILVAPPGAPATLAIPNPYPLGDDGRVLLNYFATTRDRFHHALSARAECEGHRFAFSGTLQAGPIGSSVTTFFRNGAFDGFLGRDDEFPSAARVVVDSCGRMVLATNDGESSATVRREPDGGATVLAVNGEPIPGDPEATWGILRTRPAYALFEDSTVLQSGGTVVRIGTDGSARCLASASGDCVFGAEATGPVSASANAVAFPSPLGIAVVRGEESSVFSGADLIESHDLRSVELPVLCASTEELYFAAFRSGNFGDLFVRRLDGRVERVTSFEPAATAAEDAGLEYDGPRKIRALSLGPNCDALLLVTMADNRAGMVWVGRDGGVALVVSGDDTLELTDGTSLAHRGFFPNAGRAVALDAFGGNGTGQHARVIDAEGRITLSVEQEDRSHVVLRGDPPAGRCYPPVEVNTVDDGDDLMPGDGRCDTGNAVGDRPECSLRAAIQEANANERVRSIGFALEPGAVVAPFDALPAIESSVAIDGADRGIVLDGSMVVDAGADGLSVAAGTLQVRGLTVRGFGGHGVFVEDGAGLALERGALTGHGSFGVWSNGGEVRVAGTEAAPFRITDNGGGGIAVAQDGDVLLRLRHVEVAQNGGPGVLSGHPVEADGLTVADNAGEGLATPVVDGRLCDTRVRILPGGLRARANEGAGVAIECGDLRTSLGGFLVSEDNQGWGLSIDGGRVFVGDMVTPNPRSLVRNNGVGDRWRHSDFVAGEVQQSERMERAGGVLGTTIDRDRAAQWLYDIEVHGNDGPGILLTDAVRLREASIQGNAAEGVAVRQLLEVVGMAGQGLVRGDFGTVEIAGNRGHGVFVEGGSMLSDRTQWLIHDNGGWGIVAEGGYVELGNRGLGRVEDPGAIERNGTGVDCVESDFDGSGEPTFTERDCGGGGVAIVGVEPEATRASFVDFTTVSDNAGPGVLCTERLQFSRLTVRDNVGPGIAVLVEDEFFGDAIALQQVLGPSVIAGNGAEGIVVEDGMVDLETAMTVDDNVGAGLRIASGDATLASSSYRRNGAGPLCRAYTPESAVLGAPSTEFDCEDHGGIVTENGSVEGTALIVRDNAGIGVAARRDDRTADVVLRGGELCGNTGGGASADGTRTLMGVDESCL